MVGAPAPGTVKTCTGPALLATEPGAERPISTPTPIASIKVPTPAINVLLGDMRRRRGEADWTGLAAAPPGGARSSMKGRRARPRRWPHSTQ